MGYTFECIIGFLYSLKPERLLIVGSRRFAFKGHWGLWRLQIVRRGWQCNCPTSAKYGDTYPNAQCRHVIAARRLRRTEDDHATPAGKTNWWGDRAAGPHTG